MRRHHSSPCHYLDPIRAVLELLASRFDYVGYAIAHCRLSADTPRGHTVSTTALGRGKIAMPSGLRKHTATQQQSWTVDTALLYRLADFLGSTARIAHSGEACCQGLLQRILHLNGVDHCRWKSTAGEQFGNVQGDDDMHMGIDETRQQCSAAKVDALDFWWHLQRAGIHGFDGLAFNQDVGSVHRGPTSAINEQGICE